MIWPPRTMRLTLGSPKTRPTVAASFDFSTIYMMSIPTLSRQTRRSTTISLR